MTRILVTAGALALALVVTLALFGLPVFESLSTIARGSLGSEASIARTLARTAPLLLTGLGILIAWRAGMFNIGGEGQYVVGGLCGAWAAMVFQGQSSAVITLVVLLSGVAGGALYAGLAAVLQVTRGVQVVISTILLNFIALALLKWAVAGPLRDPSSTRPQSSALPDAVMFLRPNPQTDFHTGIVLAFLAVIVVFVFLRFTATGFRLKWVGANPVAAHTQRMKVGRLQVTAMLWSGGLCGLAAAISYLGLARRLDASFTENWGFLAIPVALLGGLDPIGTLVAALYFGALFAGCEALARETSVGTSAVFVIQAVAVLVVVGLGRLQLQSSRPESKPAGGAE
ncbi:MAG: ABC transporter permease [Fimbriimonadaceae bacterium]|nr:ABC transporter permease [Fimbriimonadaceae bacterium]